MLLTIAEMKSYYDEVCPKRFNPTFLITHIFMWEEGMNTKPQIYYNNNHTSTLQASKRKKRQVR